MEVLNIYASSTNNSYSVMASDIYTNTTNINFMINGMAAYNSHKEPSKETKEIFKKNGSLSDYQSKKKNNKTDQELANRILKF